MGQTAIWDLIRMSKHGLITHFTSVQGYKAPFGLWPGSTRGDSSFPVSSHFKLPQPSIPIHDPTQFRIELALVKGLDDHIISTTQSVLCDLNCFSAIRQSPRLHCPGCEELRIHACRVKYSGVGNRGGQNGKILEMSVECFVRGTFLW